MAHNINMRNVEVNSCEKKSHIEMALEDSVGKNRSPVTQAMFSVQGQTQRIFPQYQLAYSSLPNITLIVHLSGVKCFIFNYYLTNLSSLMPMHIFRSFLSFFVIFLQTIAVFIPLSLLSGPVSLFVSSDHNLA